MRKNVQFYLLAILFLVPFIGRILIDEDRDPSSYGVTQILLDPNIMGLVVIFCISLIYIIFNFKKFVFSTFKLHFQWLWSYAFVGIITNVLFKLPSVSYFYVFEFIAVILFATVFYSIIDRSFIMKNLMFIYGVFFVIIVISFLSNLNNISLSYRLDGGLLSINPNLLGVFSAIICLFSFYLYLLRKKLRELVIFLISFIVLILTNSRTMYFAFFLGVIFLLFSNKGKSYSVNFKRLFFYFSMVILIGIIFILGSSFVTIENYILRGHSVNQIGELTGRTEGWINAFSYINENPIYGYGFKGSRLIATPDLTHSHNAFIEILLSTGVLGLLFWLIYIFKNLNNLYKLKSKIKILLSLILIVILVDSMMSASFCYSTFQLYFLVNVFGCVYLLKNKKNVKKLSSELSKNENIINS